MDGKQIIQCFSKQDLNWHVFRFNMKDFVSEDCFNRVNLNTPSKEAILYLDNFFTSRTLEPALFQNFPALKKLSLNSLRLTKIDGNTFLGLANLQELNLGENDLTEIHPGTFKDLKSLRYLSLHRNKLTVLDSSAFKGLINLNSLYLNNNRLKGIDESAFQDLSNLQVLDLSSNQLSRLEVNTFEGLNNLKCLTLSKNELSSIQCLDMFRDLRALHRLRLEENKLNQESLDLIRTLKTKCFYLSI